MHVVTQGKPDFEFHLLSNWNWLHSSEPSPCLDTCPPSKHLTLQLSHIVVMAWTFKHMISSEFYMLKLEKASYRPWQPNGYTFYMCQFTLISCPRHVISVCSCKLFIFHNLLCLWVCVRLSDEQIRCYQQKKILLHQGIHNRRFLSFHCNSKPPFLISAAEYFWPLPVIQGVALDNRRAWQEESSLSSLINCCSWFVWQNVCCL
jgi:hypothetical protein